MFGRPQRGRSVDRVPAVRRRLELGDRVAQFINDVGDLLDVPCYDTMVILQGASGLPEDRFVNLWHFAGETGIDEAAHLNGIQFELGTFYETIKEYLSTVALGAANLQIETRTYRADDPEPREPLYRTLGVDITANGATGLPNEVACVVSFFHERNVPRQRGRVYIGPLNNAVLAAPVAGVGERFLLAAAVTEFATAATGLLAGTNGVEWCTKSNMPFSSAPGSLPGPFYREVTAGWVDNACDTQRRRGMRAQSRTTF